MKLYLVSFYVIILEDNIEMSKAERVLKIRAKNLIYAIKAGRNKLKRPWNQVKFKGFEVIQ
jgi:hypothetical protein